jgi:hypothetical protein
MPQKHIVLTVPICKYTQFELLKQRFLNGIAFWVRVRSPPQNRWKCKNGLFCTSIGHFGQRRGENGLFCPLNVWEKR